MMTNIAETLKIVNLYQGAANAVTCDTISMKNFHHGAFVVRHAGSADTDLTLTVTQATDVAAGTNKAMAANVAIYADVDAGTSSDTLVRMSDAKAYTIDTGEAPNQLVVFEVKASDLDTTNGYDCVYLADSGGNASNTVSITWIGVPRYSGIPLSSAIVD